PALVEERHRLGADEPAAARDENALRHAVLVAIRSLTRPRVRSSRSASAKPSTAPVPRSQAASSASPSSQATRGAKPSSRRDRPRPCREPGEEDREHAGVRIAERLARPVDVEEPEADDRETVDRSQAETEILLPSLRERVDVPRLERGVLGRRHGLERLARLG